MIQSKKSVIVFILMVAIIVLRAFARHFNWGEIFDWVSFGGVVATAILLIIFYYYDKHKIKQKQKEDLAKNTNGFDERDE